MRALAVITFKTDHKSNFLSGKISFYAINYYTLSLRPAQDAAVYNCPFKCYNAKKAQRKVISLHRLICLLLALLLLFPTALADDRYTAFPEHLRITQKRVKTYISETSYQLTYYPNTCNQQINNELTEIIDCLAAENLPYLPRRSALTSESAMLDVGATVYRTGTSWASFLLLATVMNGTEQLHISFDTRAYDMEAGEKLSLGDVITNDGFSILLEETQKQLAAYFPQYEADAEKLAALCSEENIQSAPFTLSPAFLQLHFPSDTLYDHEGVIMHVRIPYTQLSACLTEKAKAQTDNSRYRLVALTYDDGPTRRQTISILRSLRSGGLNATFFVVGERIAGSPDLISLEHNAGFAIASHNYEHIYANAMTGKVAAYRNKMNAELCQIVGQGVSMMRAPGGLEQIYIDENVGMPLIHWSLASKDGNSTDFDPLNEALRLTYSLKDGSIVLMHDLRAASANYSAYLPQLLNDRGYMCVTVEELFALRGIPLEANTVYYDAPRTQ